MANSELISSIQAGLIDSSFSSIDDLRPQLLVNKQPEFKVINHIRKELASCDEFMFSVAFITNSGLAMLKHTLKELAINGIKGKILTADYLNFNNPDMFYDLLKIPNVEVKISCNDNFHAKGYLFKHKEQYTFIVGSANLTDNALTRNTEWNLKVTSSNNGKLVAEALSEFNNEWSKANTLTPEWIEQYRKIYNEVKIFQRPNKESGFYKRLEPNKMQQKALDNLKRQRENGVKKSLLISATGTGKTFLSVFDVYNFKPRRMLFIAHRELLLKKAMESFSYKFDNSVSKGIFNGTNKDYNCDFVFASINMMSKDESLSLFKPDDFDYIIIDEVHRAGAASYKKVIDYFKPKFLLGMSATPERTDGFNIYELFDYNIAYEIRLQKALEEDLLCPFHYYGINDVTVGGISISDDYNFNYLTADERVKHIMSSAEYYGYSGTRVKGLIFVSGINEAFQLEKIFNEKGWRTLALVGSTTDEVRSDAIDRLESNTRLDYLDYIITVDIFNEGVDIPAVNQVIMLRATQSAIIFIQQLGRGLRKAQNKDYVVILDFIGNYQNNYLIPIALSEDHTYDKDNIRRFMNTNETIIPGSSTVEFDKVVKERIFEKINEANFSEAKFIKDEYIKLKNKIGHIPTHMDFINYEAIDLKIIINKYNSYIAFLNRYEKECNYCFNDEEMDYINFVSSELSDGKRIYELNIISDILASRNIEYNEEYKSAISFLSGGFLRDVEWKKYNHVTIYKNERFISLLKNEEFRTVINDIVSFGLKCNELKYSNTYLDTQFCLYEKYTRKDVCRLINMNKNLVALNIGGYFYDEDTNEMAVYVTYNKDENISETIQYEDRFINRGLITCISKNKRTIQSNDIQTIINSVKNKTNIHLFVKKSNNEEAEFYYLGKIIPTADILETKGRTNDPIVEITYQLETPCKEELYNYLIN